jgi:hypothetical protein
MPVFEPAARGDGRVQRPSLGSPSRLDDQCPVVAQVHDVGGGRVIGLSCVPQPPFRKTYASPNGAAGTAVRRDRRPLPH